jgi:isopenicillin N synthase-like dioxygenase
MSYAVPVIDLDTVTGADLVDLLRRHACFVIGSGHGISDDLWRSTIEVSKAFFDLPAEMKEPCRWPGAGPWMGWLPVGATDRPGEERPKLLEKYEITLPNPWSGNVDDDEDVASRAAQFHRWPEQPDDFVPTWVRAYAALGALAERVVSMLIDALDLPEGERAAWTTEHHANLVVNNYMALDAPPAEGQLRHTGHVDIGGITLLSAEEAPGGLEIWAEGAWQPVVLPPNGHLVQVGDLLRRWTDDLIPGNLHRVVNPPPELGSVARRTSLVYFHYPALATEVVPAPSCRRSEDGSRRALRSGDHMMHRQRREAEGMTTADLLRAP